MKQLKLMAAPTHGDVERAMQSLAELFDDVNHGGAALGDYMPFTINGRKLAVIVEYWHEDGGNMLTRCIECGRKHLDVEGAQ